MASPGNPIPVVHRLTSWGFLVCGPARRIDDKVTSLDRKTTCGPCLKRRRAHQKGAKVRAAANGWM